jgi:type IV pilus assembly protein PilO
MELSLTRLPWYGQVGAFVLLAIGGVGAFFYYYEMPVRADFVSRESQLEGLKKDIAMGVSTARKLPEFRRQVGDLEARLANLKAVLPEEKDAADLLRRMQTVAAQSNLTIKSFKPEPTVTKQLHAEWPIRLELEGTYHNLALFFDRVSKFTRIVNISGLEVKGKDKNKEGNTISASCVATTFVLLDKQTAAAASGKAGAKAPGGRGAGARGAGPNAPKGT